MINGISVIMPTYNQSTFIRRAIISLQKQSFTQWELIVINDGSADETDYYLSDVLNDERIRYIKNPSNTGLGAALNQGVKLAAYDYIAYLPSDDFYYDNHLSSIKDTIESYPDAVLAFSGIQCEMGDTVTGFKGNTSKGLRQGYPMQLVQVCHKKIEEQWIERNEWVSENLFDMYWSKLINKGVFVPTNKISCFWTSHPLQRHKILGERYGGGLNFYRVYYGIKNPIKMKTSKYKFINEEKSYASFRKNIPRAKDSLKILLVGELAYNAERIYALEQAGHQLYGLWVQRPSHTFNTVGPLPFGHVSDVPYENRQEEVSKIQPDIIYALLNFGAVPLAYEVLKNNRHIPFVWHFKEGPSLCLQNGNWDKLIYLYTFSDGKIYLNEVAKAWFEQFIPATGLNFILDGDLPKIDYFGNDFSKKLSLSDGAIHTVVAGRMLGISQTDIQYLAKENIHIHLYSENYHNQREGQNKIWKAAAPEHFHVHPHCAPAEWVREFSRYDAGWLHCLSGQNNNNLLIASWDDLNIPARTNTYAAAGLPMLLKDNPEHVNAVKDRLQSLDMGVFFKSMEDLASQLKDRNRMTAITQNVIKSRYLFSFDYHVNDLIAFFRDVIRHKKQNDNPQNDLILDGIK